MRRYLLSAPGQLRTVVKRKLGQNEARMWQSVIREPASDGMKNPRISALPSSGLKIGHVSLNLPGKRFFSSESLLLALYT